MADSKVTPEGLEYLLPNGGETDSRIRAGFGRKQNGVAVLDSGDISRSYDTYFRCYYRTAGLW